MESKNPVLSEKNFRGRYTKDLGVSSSYMTMNGTILKTGFLLLFLLAGSIAPWYVVHMKVAPAETIYGFLIAGALVSMVIAFVLSLVIIFVPRLSPFLAPLYAVFEGILLGAISLIFESRYPGIAMQAFLLTIAVLSLMLFLYRMRIIRVTQTFRTAVICATGAIGLVYFASFILSFFGIYFSFLHDSSPLSIGISLFVVGVAALNLTLDFDIIERGVKARAPKYMEWYGGFALLVTLVWLYLELLRLLAKLKSRD